MKQEKARKVKKVTDTRREFIPDQSYPRTTNIARWVVTAILAIVPFHAFLTVFGASLGANYTALRLWSAGALCVLVALELYWFWRDKELRQWLFQNYLVRVVVLFILLQGLFAIRGVFFGYVDRSSAIVGLWLNIRYVIFFMSVILLCRYIKFSRETIMRVVLGAGVLVALFAFVQYTILPVNFLSHFGYSEMTIKPYETINSNNKYIRVISTTRGANPLGAYMLIISMLIVAFWCKIGSKLIASVLLALSVAALIFSFSRSAWIGLLVSFVMFVGLQLRTKRHWRHFGLVSLAIVLIATTVFVIFRDDPALQNALYHTEDASTIAISSNDQRASAITTATQDILREPLGRGVGSAGPASVHNTKSQGRLAENYFLQIGQETGWFGLFAYVALLFIAGIQLWRQRQSTFSLVLLALLVGLSFVNLLSHAWTDDTTAFIWWGLAGVAIGDKIWREKSPTH